MERRENFYYIKSESFCCIHAMSQLLDDNPGHPTWSCSCPQTQNYVFLCQSECVILAINSQNLNTTSNANALLNL